MSEIKSAAAVIPARYASTRFPGKALVDLCGKPLIQHVYEQVTKATLLKETVVATDDKRIFDCVENFGGRAVMTSPNHPTGTDRINEAAQGLDVELILNVQGDEPLIEPELIDRSVREFSAEPDFKMGSVVCRIELEEDLKNPNVVKAVVDQRGYALYFSRYSLPYRRVESGHPTYQHLGFYVYSKAFLGEFAKMEPTPLEKTECLEQLRALENGIPIKIIESEYRGIGLDAPEEIPRIEWFLKQKGL